MSTLHTMRETQKHKEYTHCCNCATKAKQYGKEEEKGTKHNTRNLDQNPTTIPTKSASRQRRKLVAGWGGGFGTVTRKERNRKKMKRKETAAIHYADGKSGPGVKEDGKS
eukprot:RCo019196